MKTAEQQIFEMLVECTGTAMCDSGGERQPDGTVKYGYGRNWEQNQGKTLGDFENEPEVKLEFYDGKAEYYIISVFHYLTKQLEIDAICREFNNANGDGDPNEVKDWDCEDFPRVSIKAGKVLDRYNAVIGEGWNSYNGESSLSQVIQGTYVRIADNDYVVLQIHGGCDVRGGYTNAKLFRIVNSYGECLAPEEVFGTITPKDADTETPALPGCEHIMVSDVIQFSNTYDGYSLRNDNDNEIEIKETDNVNLSLGIW